MTRRRSRWARAPWLAWGALLTGCVQGDYDRVRVFQRLAPEAVAGLRAGADTLDDVLLRLGAPLFVTELGDDVALAYGWLDNTAWNVEVQVPVADNVGFQFRYDRDRLHLPGVVVFLDRALVVTRVERGVLEDLLPTRPRPQAFEPESASGG